jgi:hypothetical protein
MINWYSRRAAEVPEHRQHTPGEAYHHRLDVSGVVGYEFSDAERLEAEFKKTASEDPDFYRFVLGRVNREIEAGLLPRGAKHEVIGLMLTAGAFLESRNEVEELEALLGQTDTVEPNLDTAA